MIYGASNISIFSPTTSLGRFGGEGFRSRRFQIETLYRKKGLIKKSQPVKSERLSLVVKISLLRDQSLLMVGGGAEDIKGGHQ